MNDEAIPLLEDMKGIYEQVKTDGDKIYNEWIKEDIREDYDESAKNLAYYMAFRKYDRRNVQEALIPWGLSSLGRLEADVLGTLGAVVKTLGYITDQGIDDIEYHSKSSFEKRYYRLDNNTTEILGENDDDRNTEILVTMPTSAGSDYDLVKNLVEAGMNLARINCAHDDEETWQNMVDNIKKASEETGKSCGVMMDISGPKIRVKHLLTSKRNPKVMEGEKFLLSSRDRMTLPRNMEIAINTSVPEVLDKVEESQLIKIDDGQIEAQVTDITDEGLICEVTRTLKEDGSKMKTEKGTNFPDLDMQLSVLTEKDMEDLDFAVHHADSIAFSFVKDKNDMKYIEEVLNEKGAAGNLPIIAKIETSEAIPNLPHIIATASAKRPFGVMVARGDLAVEVGYERLSELQEELLWVCEAGHIPVIWATQVMESLVKTGIPTRSEISDVVAGSRAECIMLNKGEYIVEGVRVVGDILKKFENHHYKKTAMLRALSIAQNLNE